MVERISNMSNAEITKPKKQKRERRVLFAVMFVVFMIYALTLILPFLWIFYNSFKTSQEFIFDSIWSFPKAPTLDNWINAFSQEAHGITLPHMFLNSVIFVVMCTFTSIASSGVTAYCLAKYKFPGRQVLYTIAILLMTVPMLGSLASMYKFLVDIKVYDTYFCMFFLSTSGFGTGFLLLYGFFKTLSWSYSEAAFVDGAGHFTVFFKIMLPMALPGVASVALMSAIGIWNDYYTFYMYVPSKVTVAYGLSIFLNVAQQNGNFPGLFAPLLLSIAPVILVFCVFQKKIMTNMTIGGLKG